MKQQKAGWNKNPRSSEVADMFSVQMFPDIHKSRMLYGLSSCNIWSPNSPDCKPMDQNMSGAVEEDTNRAACNTKA